MLVDINSASPLPDAIRRVVHDEGRNYSIVITGKTQSRKSTTALSLAKAIDPRFNMDEQMAILNPGSAVDMLRKEDLKRGSVILLDEQGVMSDHHQYHNILVRNIQKILQQWGYKGLVLISTTPYFSFVDKDTRSLFDLLIRIENKNDKKKYTTAKVLELQWNERLGQMYYHRPVATNGLRTWTVDAFKIPYPPKEILEKYYGISKSVKSASIADFQSQINQLEKEKIKRLFDPSSCVEKILAEPDRFTSVFNGRKFISKELVMEEFKTGDTRSRLVKKMAEEKLGIGYSRGDL